MTFSWDSKCKECVLEWNCWPVEFSDHFPDSDRGQGGIFIRVQFYAGQEEIGSWHKIDRLPSLRIFNEYYSCQILCPTLKINILVLFRSNNNPCSWDSFLTFPQKTWISKYISLFYKLIKFLVTFQSSGRLVGSSTNRYTGNHNIWFIELLWTGVNAVQCAMVWTYLSRRPRREWWLQKEGINFQALHHHQRPAMPTYLHHCTSGDH